MARCTENEKRRSIYFLWSDDYGIIALIWCMVGLSFYPEQASFSRSIKGDAIQSGL